MNIVDEFVDIIELYTLAKNQKNTVFKEDRLNILRYKQVHCVKKNKMNIEL